MNRDWAFNEESRHKIPVIGECLSLSAITAASVEFINPL